MTRRGLLSTLGGLAAGVVGGRHDKQPQVVRIDDSKATAEAMAAKMKDLLDEQDKKVVVEIDGKQILQSLQKLKRRNGGPLGLA